MAAIREYIILDTSKYKAATREVRGETRRMAAENQKNVEKGAQGMQSSFKRIGQSAKLWIAGAAAGAALVLRQAFNSLRKEVIQADAEFTKSFAIQGDLTEQQKRRMISTAREVSRELNLSNDQVAESYYFLASAGLDVEEQIANLPVVARFAKAGMFDLATATDLLTDAQSALGLTVNDTIQNQENMIRVSDVLSKANQIANASVQQFSESLTNKSASALKNYNKDLEEGVSVLAAYADQGVKGRLAGERLNILLKRLAEQSVNNKEAFRQMNIQVFDAQGNYRNIADIVEDLENALGSLSTEQKQAALAQLGFTAESQDSVLALIGLSDKIREYESNLRDAAGTTEDIADKQMRSLQERLEQVRRKFVDTFGPALLSMMEKAIGKLEGFVDQLGRIQSRWADSPSRQVLQSLRDLDAPASLIASFERQVAVEEATALKNQLEKEIGEIQVPIGIDDKNVTEKVGDMLSTFWEGLNKPGYKNMFGQFLIDSIDEVQNFQFTEEAFDTTKVGEYRKQIEMLNDRIVEYSEKVADMDDSREKSILSELILKMREQRDAITEAVSKYEALKAAEEGINEARTQSVVSTENQTEQQEEQNQTVEESVDIQRRSFEAVNLLGKKVRELADVKMDGLVSEFEQFQNKVTKLNNEFEAGNISQEQYEKRLAKLGSEMKKNLTEVFNTIRGQLTPEQQKLWKSMIDGVKGTNEELEDTDSQLRDIADAASSVLTLAEAFGEVDEQVRSVIRGTIEVLRNLDNLKGASGLGVIAPALGVGAGVISVISGIIGGNREEARQERRRMRELQNSLNSLRRAVDRNTQAFYEQSVVGGDISMSDIDRGRELIANLDPERVRQVIQDAWENMDPWDADSRDEFDSIVNSEISRVRDVLAELGELFPEIFGNALEMFDQTLEAEGMEAAFDKLSGFSGMLDRLRNTFGEFGDSLEGAIAEFRASIEFGGMELEDAIAQFIQRVSEMDDVSDEMKKKLSQIAGLDLTTEEGKKQLEELITAIFSDRDSLMGDMTPDEFNQLLEFLRGLDDGSVTGSTVDDEGFARSTQIARTITDVQANEVVMLLEAIEYWTRQTAARLGDPTALSMPDNFKVQGFDIPIPLPVEITNWNDKPDDLSGVERESGKPLTMYNTYNVSAPAGSDPGGIDYDRLGQEIGRRVQRELISIKF